jgi:uncharacterized repeat protein (TIGR03803 family)
MSREETLMSATLTTIANFPTSTGSGADPDGQLFMDSSGNLIGATVHGGANGIGTTYEIAKVAGGYATTPTFLADIPGGLNTLVGVPNLSADPSGNLFGLMITGGTNTQGTIVEFPAGGGQQVQLANFAGGANGSGPGGRLLVDSNGNLFGTTSSGGANNAGTVFELKKTGATYATTPTTLTSFGAGIVPSGLGNLVEDAAGDIFGTTSTSVFEVKKNGASYSSPVILVPFPVGTQIGYLTIDSKGNIFGTTITGGENDDGTVFEIEKTPTGYASTPTTIASFTDADGKLNINRPKSLIVDANGSLFGTTDPSSANSGGVVFEIQRTQNGYVSTPQIVADFNGGANGVGLGASLAVDSSGNLFGTTQTGGTNGTGTAFEITNSGFATAPIIVPIISDLLWQNRSTGAASIWQMDATTKIGGGAVAANPGTAWTAIGMGTFFTGDTSDILWHNASTGQTSIWAMTVNTRTGGGAVANSPGPAWNPVGTGDFNDDGHSDILWQNSSTGQASIWEMDGNTRTGGGALATNPGPAWTAVGTGDFNHDGHADILWRNASTGQAAIWEMDGTNRIGGGAIANSPGTAWKAVGTGDFFGNGLSDILWQNTTTGQLSAWEMSDNTRIGGGAVATIPGPSWQALGTGAGGSDILWQNTNTGQTSIWEMAGNARTGGGPVTPIPGTTWRAVDLS